MLDHATPLNGHLVPDAVLAGERAGRGIVIREVRPRSLFQVGAWPDSAVPAREAVANATGAVPVAEPGRFAGTGDTLVVTLAPGKHLVLSDREGLEGAVRRGLAPEQAAVVDLSHSRCGIRISGPAAAAVLAKGFALDLDPRVFPAGSAAQTTIHQIGVLVIRRSKTVFDLFVYGSFAVAFADWLTDAAAEFGWGVSSPAAVGE